MRYDIKDGSYIPEEGLYFYNEKEGAIGTRLRPGKQASLLDWIEITEQQKQEIEAKEKAQENAENI